MIYKKIFKNLYRSPNEIHGKLEKNPRYYHGFSYNKYKIKKPGKNIELIVDKNQQKILEGHLWHEVKVFGSYVSEFLFKVERIQNDENEFLLPPDLSKRFDEQFFQNQISKGLFLQPCMEDCMI